MVRRAETVEHRAEQRRVLLGHRLLYPRQLRGEFGREVGGGSCASGSGSG